MRNSSCVSPQQKETLTRWFSDPDTWVGVFENQDLSHPDRGRRIALSYSLKDFDKAKAGDPAPLLNSGDGGWRYVLKSKCQNYQQALDALRLYDIADEFVCDNTSNDGGYIHE